MPVQNGWLRKRHKRHRKAGDVWVYCHRRRCLDGKWVEATGTQVGPLSELPTEEAAWQRVNELGLKPHALCPLQDDQRIRSDDSHPRTGVCNRV